MVQQMNIFGPMSLNLNNNPEAAIILHLQRWHSMLSNVLPPIYELIIALTFLFANHVVQPHSMQNIYFSYFIALGLLLAF